MAETETYDRFLQLKDDLSRCYDSKRYYKQKIRFLLSDYLPFDLLEKSTTTLVLLYNIERHNRGLITPSNVDLLFEITQILQVKEAEDLVNQYMEENNVQITNHRTLSRYRMKMFRALEEVSTDVRHLTVYYRLYNNFQNVWDLVLKLEMANYLADEPDKLGKFARLLNPTAKAILLDYDEQDDDYRKELTIDLHRESHTDILKWIKNFCNEHWWIICSFLITVFAICTQSLLPARIAISIGFCLILVGIIWFLHDNVTKTNVSHYKKLPEDQLVVLNVSSKGGTLHLKAEDIKLEIPPGAIEEGKAVNISLENFMEEIDFPVLHPLESVVSPVVKCRPGGTVFHKPCTLSFPHNAVNEEFWKFTLLVKNRIEDKWRQISLKSDEKDITFTVCKGRCYVTLNHFCQYVAVGHPADVNYMVKRKMKLLVFRKRITNFKYELQIRLCNPGDTKKITEEHEQHEGKLLQTPVDILCLNKNMIITVESNSDEWRIMEQEKKINAEYIWHATPQKSFQLTRRNLSENLLNVTVSPSQEGNEIDPVNVNCELENPILNQMRSFWKFLKEHRWIVTVSLFFLLLIAVVLIYYFTKEPLIIGLCFSVFIACVPFIWYVHKKMTRAQQSENTTAGRQTTTV